MSQTRTPDETYAEFREAVNMSAAELKRWLETEESRSVGWTGSSADGGRKTEAGGEESTGHESGRHIVELLHTKKGDLRDEDYAQMRRVVSYVHRHLAQQPTKEEIATSRWRYSLMNWGHDPLK